MGGEHCISPAIYPGRIPSHAVFSNHHVMDVSIGAGSAQAFAFKTTRTKPASGNDAISPAGEATSVPETVTIMRAVHRGRWRAQGDGELEMSEMKTVAATRIALAVGGILGARCGARRRAGAAASLDG